MTVLENVELCNNGYVEAKMLGASQKIKLRNSSYTVIVDRYSVFAKQVTPVAVQPIVNVNLTPVTPETAVAQNKVESGVEITEIVAIPRIAEMVTLLQIQGKINHQGYKALKIKPQMYENMLKNSSTNANAVESIPAPAPEPKSEIVAPEVKEPQLVAETQADEVHDNAFKVSRNGSSAAKVDKFMETVNENSNTEISPPAFQVADEVSVISPTVIEQESARPVSREMSLIAPERNSVEEKKQLNLEPAAYADDITNISLDITNLTAIKDYLAKTAQLKAAAAEAKSKENAAKADAARAEQEASSRRDEFVKTAERIAAHQEDLIAQTEQSNAQASIYEAKKGEFEAERDEYQKAIDDMLAIIGDENKNTQKREKVM